MQDNQSYLRELFKKVVANQCSTDELETFFRLVRELPDNEALVAELDNYWDETYAAVQPGEQSKGDELYAKVLRGVNGNQPPAISAHRVRFLKTAWFRYAAAILIIIGIGAYFYTYQTSKPVVTKTYTVAGVPAPGTNRATLTLANGQKIFIDSAGQGILASEGGANIEKTGDGNIIYKGSGINQEPQYNILSVPRGSQLASIVLSDGSKVYLNAASSLKYPVVFSADERRVEITGEAYFEIAKDAKRKFVVANGNIETEVLGTSFNVNTYADEPAAKITLVEGKVKVSSNNKSIIIQPGEQVEAHANEIKRNDNVDIEEVVAWKNGRFLFNSADIETIMRQVARWYDVDVVYEKKTTETISGALPRSENVSQLLKILEATGKVDFKINGKQIIVKPKQ